MREKAIEHLFASYFTHNKRPDLRFESIQHGNCGALTVTNSRGGGVACPSLFWELWEMGMSLSFWEL